MAVETFSNRFAAIYSTLITSFVARLPWQDNASQPVIHNQSLMKLPKEVTFDSFGILAVLPNPRASSSAARLYIQPDFHVFRWPHLLQIGAVLTPLSMLVKHLTGNWKSVHPGTDVCKESMDWIKVRSDISSMHEFEELSVSTHNQWLSDVLNFKPSKYPSNDINI